MFIPIIISVRGSILASLIVIGIGIFVVLNNSKEKSEYVKSTGIIQYLDNEFQSLPMRNKGDYKYLKIDSYSYFFEIFEPNSKPSDKTIDDLKVGDNIDIYYYETADTKVSGLNRYVQFIDSNGNSYFIRNGFQRQLGFLLIGLSFPINIMAFLFWKKGKLNW